MMMRNIYLLAIGMLIAIPGFSQEGDAPAKVTKAAFFDKSKPLREMPMYQAKTRDNSWKDGIVENPSLDMEMNGNKNLITDPKSIQSKNGSKNSKGPLVNFSGTGMSGFAPADTDGDVSPDHYMQMVNVAFAIYEKDGTKVYGPVDNITLWDGFPGPWSNTNDGDPIIIWDDLSERWLASQFAVSTSNGTDYELIAISETSDPLGSWYRYAFEFDMMPDYPKISAWTDGYYATFHMFQGSFQGTGYAVFEKEKMLIGDPDAQMIYFGEYASRYGFLPADCDGVAPPAGEPCYFAGVNFFGNHYMQIFKLIPDWDNPSNSLLTTAANLPTDAFSTIIDGVSQPGAGVQLDAQENKTMYRLPYRNFGTHQTMLANHVVKVGNHTGIRWYEMRDEGSGWFIYQQGTYAPDDDNRWMGSMAIAENGDIALGYSVSSSTVYPSIRYTGRTPDAPLGEMNIAEIEVKTGLSSQTWTDRWGDYSSMTTDPSEPNVFWYTTEYMKTGGNWGTQIVSFNFDALQQPEIYAGNDSIICDDVLFETDASGISYTSVLWTTDGDGILQNATTLDAKYLRGNGDIANGGFTLSITVQGYEPGWEATDEVYVAIISAPDVIAGNDTTIHMNHMAYLHGEAGDYSSVLWTSNGDGSFANETDIITTYTPGSSDISNGQVQLTLTAQAMEPCEGQDADNLTVFIDPTVGIGQSRFTDNFVKIIPNPSDGQFSVQITGRDEAENFTFSVLDYTGRVVFSNNYTAGQLSNKIFDLSSYPKGLYFMEIRNEEFNALEKIVVK